MSLAPAPLSVLWRDEHLVAVYKPAGWLVHRTGLDAGETRFVMQTLRDQLGQHVFPVHRLDKGTCGVLVMALHSDAARALSQAFEQHRTRKHYLALVRGWAPGAVEVDHALRPDDAPPDAPVQDARTRFERLATLALAPAEGEAPADPRYPSSRLSLVQAWPETGRRHQIRRHLKHLAHPIIGDATHGKGPLNRWWAHHLGQARLWLHAASLTLPHPVHGQALQFSSGLFAPAGLAGHAPCQDTPADLQDWQRLLQRWPWQRDSDTWGTSPHTDQRAQR
ncbi:pseudouridine synthase [Curvibacter sp. RS43]|uniref:pseudouridine synthase n=1 Tax=Curvibacter microcysteis TaxID=3026419 RepID=UPI002362DEED|nr:pseudouridine synthase [Curvibacter sp. RS43]MDD0810551.1 pseudouridine synthase [Curvibacter sp. RS43]